MTHFEYESEMPVPAKALFTWHARPGAFERLQPPWERIELLHREGGILPGDELEMKLKVLGPLGIRWLARHGDYEEGHHFTDTQVRGPFARWTHRHICESAEGDRSQLRDVVDYALPLGALGRFVGGRSVRKKLQLMFALRHDRTRWDLERHAAVAHHGPQHVVLSGASGLIGTALESFLTTGGHTVSRLVRRPPRSANEILWSPSTGELDVQALEGVDAVIHLAGESIDQRWTEERKRRILESRRAGTRLLAEGLASLERPPRVWLSASAVGFYGDRGDAALDEGSEAGSGFLAEVCQAWEEAAAPARDAGIRVVHPRLGVVLTAAGGALDRMLTPFKMGLGGRVGSGEQYQSWVALEDVLGALYHMLFDARLEGPVNVTAPHPVTQRDFASTLGRVLWRPSVVPLPAFAVRTLFGEMGESLLLEGARVLPARLQATGFRFVFRELEEVLRWELGQPRA